MSILARFVEARSVLFLSLLLLPACGDDGAAPLSPGDDTVDGAAPAPVTTGTPGTEQDAAPAARCDEGASKECRVDLGDHDGKHECFVGVTVCVDGAWSRCVSRKAADTMLAEVALALASGDAGIP